MQDVCISLEVADPTSLPAAVSKVLRAVATLPRLERFVGEVCQVTSQATQLHIKLSFAHNDLVSIMRVIPAWQSHQQGQLSLVSCT